MTIASSSHNNNNSTSGTTPPLPPKSTSHTRRSNGEWSHSASGLWTSESPFTPFSRTRMSSSSFAVTSVGVPATTGVAPVNNPDPEFDEGEYSTSLADSSGSTSSNRQMTAAAAAAVAAQGRPSLGDRQWSEDDFASSVAFAIPSDDQQGNNTNTKRQHKLRLAQRETRQLRWLRGATLAVFCIATALVSVAVHRSLTSYQDDQFQALVEQQSLAYLDQMHTKLTTQILIGLQEWSYLYQPAVSLDTMDGSSPFVTVTPSFLTRAETFLKRSHTAWMGMAPIVNASSQQDWERYSRLQAHTWITPNPALMPTKIHPESTSSSEYAAPLWQQAPLISAEWINLDILQLSSTPLPNEFLGATALLQKNDDVSPTVVMGDFHFLDWTQRFPPPADMTKNNNTIDLEWLQSMLYYPIVVTAKVKNETSATTVGVMMASIDWNILLQQDDDEETLSSSFGLVTGMIVIVSNQCPKNGTNTTQQYVYQVVTDDDNNNNNNSNDGHTLQRISQVPSNARMDLASELDITQAMAKVPLTTVPQFRTNYCQYSLQVLPTQSVQDDYEITSLSGHSATPAIYTGGIVAIFVFCALLFVAYDCLVRKRQHKVMKSAAKTHEIVAGLFPEMVRNRLFGDSIYKSNNKDAAAMYQLSEPTSPNGNQDKSHKKKQDDQETVPTSPSKSNGDPAKSGNDDDLVSPRKPNVLNASERTTSNNNKDRPIADLFPHTTVMFADICGFTAWSSARDPSQVFTLLETIYAAFDRLAFQRRVFKVETIGDCYVAVTGLPNPQEDHAIIMVKFARDCLKTMQALVQSLEVELGPDTGDLSIRVGLHSGPVTAGVLRGQKSRFQLFGDTVNFASRMESNGWPNQIQCSQQTADLLILANKNHWIHPRKDSVHAKGKGLVQTYWVIGSKPTTSTNAGEDSHRSLGAATTISKSGDDKMDTGAEAAAASFSHLDDDHSDITEEPLDNIYTPHPTPPPGRRGNNGKESELMDPLEISPHLQRLIDWNVDILSKIITTIVATRYARKSMDLQDTTQIKTESSSGPPPTLIVNSNPRNEYCEAIQLPTYDPSRKIKRISEVGGATNAVDEQVRTQLRDYITTIACAYNDNPFHNFEHASHVTMSAHKLLKRVVNAEHVRCRRGSLDNLASKLHHYTYGITSDPLTHFACLFSALIHDVDHPGISNAQMLKEEHPLAEVYDGKSIAEQNSFDFAWELLMDTEFDSLRRCLFENEKDLERFRQLVVNSIMATDVFDPELVRIRNERWRQAFPQNVQSLEVDGESKEGEIAGVKETPATTEPNPNGISCSTLDLKATVVIEHIIQAADVAHTMQHWHVYQKWNRRLFAEMYASFSAGKSPVNPAEVWYDGELWFFDNYIIPLAKKLRQCQVFGVSSDEFLTYALDNKSEWEQKGKVIIQDMMAACTNKSEEFLLNEMSKK